MVPRGGGGGRGAGGDCEVHVRSPTARAMDSVYPLNNDTANPIYGDFPGCRILGDPCTIRVRPLDARDPRATDILGFASFIPGGFAIHISGMNDFGRKDQPRRIHGLGLMQCLWEREGRHPSGTGCQSPDTVVIMAGEENHFCHWHRTNGFLTLQGLYDWDACDQRPFTANDVAHYINNTTDRLFNLQPRNISVIRKFLDAMVGATNHGIVSDDGKIGVARLMRAGGRYLYQWRRHE